MTERSPAYNEQFSDRKRESDTDRSCLVNASDTDSGFPERWRGSVVAMANFRDLGLSDDAAQLHDFMVEEIRKRSRTREDYERLYKAWSMEVNKCEKRMQVGREID